MLSSSCLSSQDPRSFTHFGRHLFSLHLKSYGDPVCLPVCASLLVCFLSHSFLLNPLCTTVPPGVNSEMSTSSCRLALKLWEEEEVDHVVSFSFLSCLINTNICLSVSVSLLLFLSVFLSVDIFGLPHHFSILYFICFCPCTALSCTAEKV